MRRDSDKHFTRAYRLKRPALVVQAVAVPETIRQAAPDVLGFVLPLLQLELGLEPDHVGVIDQLISARPWNADQPDRLGFAHPETTESTGASHVSTDVACELEMCFVDLAEVVRLRLAVCLDVFQANFIGRTGVVRPPVEACLPHDLWAVIWFGHCPAATFSTVVWLSY